MQYDIKEELALVKRRAARLKTACENAEKLLEEKSRELFEANQKLTESQKVLKNDVDQTAYELSVTNKRLQKALDEKSNLIGQVSHEVRTPLNAIVGLSEILLTTSLDKTQHDYINTINSGANSLIILLNDMLDITKIEAGRVELNPEPVEIRSALKNVVTMFRQTAAQKGLSLSLKVSSTIPASLNIDKGRYKQIINNLINNAVKNTNEGGIVIQVSYTADTIYKGVGTLKTRVIDSGIGIPSNKLKTIFNAYEQLAQTGEGVGLGLSICQQLCGLMMGKISCKSKVNQGSVFEVSLPAEQLTDTHETEKSSTTKPLKSLQPLKILVAEDNPTNQKVITAQLSQLGQRADITNNGQEAYDKLAQGHYDVLICDLLMPILDGEQTIRKIRSSNANIAGQYCIALTASNYQDQRTKLLDAGFDAFLSKPASLEQLADALSRVPYDLWLDSPIINPLESDKQKVDDNSDKKTFDFTFLKTQFGEAYRSIFKEIAPSFLEHTYQELENLETYQGNANIEKIKKASHSMKGAASSIGLSELASLLSQIESKPSSLETANYIKKVRNMMDKLKPIIIDEIARS